ncbi:MAG TPA: tetratricopeptide repeat protein [Methylomirabilota bacterium]|nr:tetratricopeptide repeat protein [Methylomirabilota bacterium]
MNQPSPEPGKPECPIEPPDHHHLNAAIGWLELGNPTEAGEEIARLSPPLLDHPDVLEVRWAICAALQSWDAALAVAEVLVARYPERDSGWVHRAYALRRVRGRGLEEAWAALRPAFERFPKVPVIPYNLACYACQFGRKEEAWEWLHKAMEAAGSVDKIKQMALADADLQELWDRLRSL